MNGILNINKPKDWTSFDCVNYLKRMLKMKKIGHLGTLDPMAEGVLVITLGNATKLFDMFLKKDKTYMAKFEFGYVTDSLDATGNVVNTTKNIPTIEEIKNVLPDFKGEISQLPPQFSAKKVDGKKAYEVARAGEHIDLKPAIVKINSIEIIDYKEKILTLKIDCGAGTYIRSIGRDIAEKLNSLATMIELKREKVGAFKLSDSVEIKSLNFENINEFIIPTDFCFKDLEIIDDEFLVSRLLNGAIISTNNYKSGDYRLYRAGEFVALASVKDNKIKMSKYFGN